MTATLTNESINTATPTNEELTQANKTWADTDPQTWGEQAGTWDNAYNFNNEALNNATLSNESLS